jgi:hypothetical protein
MVVVMMIPAIVVIVIAVRAVMMMMMVMMPPTVMVMMIRSSVPDHLACRQWVIRVVLTVGRSLPVYPQLRTYRCTALSDAMCQCTKSLRDSPLRG